MECAACGRERYLAATHLTIAGHGDRRVGDLIGRSTMAAAARPSWSN
jgi:hypothetical protein